MEENKMKEMDCVELAVEKEKYTKDGIHKGMQGWICDSRNIDNSWLVNFPQYGERSDLATIAVKETDLIMLPQGMDASVNEKIKDDFEKSDDSAKEFLKPDDLSEFMI